MFTQQEPMTAPVKISADSKKLIFGYQKLRRAFFEESEKVTLLKNFFRILQVSSCQKFFEVIWY